MIGVTPAEVMERLAQLAEELDQRSLELGDVERRLEPAELAYQVFVDEFEVGLWTKHENAGSKLPSESLRLKLAHKEIDPALLGRYQGLLHSRKRLEKRINALKSQVDAQRSILSALKLEMEVVSR